MSTTIDERVVGMRFDNQHFERNVQTSLGTIDKLKTSLNFTGASKGLENIEAASRNVNLSGVSSAVETVGLKFNALYTIADQVFRNITNSAYYAGKRIVSALTIDPIKTGFNEYELKMGSIQTIMASTGEELETVNKYLNELNEYSDKTIYSFSDMTQNIGKFTNAGVKLEDAVAAIQGISNEAAVSGANAGEASRAMYNFAQALSSGYVKLIDWKSIENANMATLEFKEQLIGTAVELGTVTKGADGMYTTLSGKTFNATKNFNDVLQEQWMTSDVLISTLKKYSDETTEIGKKAFSAAQDVKTLSQLFDTLKESAQSGWAQTWEYVVGDLNEAKTELRKINEIISGVLEASADARNSVLEGWKNAGGRATMFEALYNILDAIGKVVKPIKDAFSDIFPPFTADTLVSMTNALRDFTEWLKIGDGTADKIRRTFRGLFAVLDIIKMAFKAVFDVVKPLFGFVDDAGGGILDITAYFGDWLTRLRDLIKSTDVFNKVLGAIVGVIKKVTNFLKDTFVVPGIDFFASMLDKIRSGLSVVGTVAEGTKSVLGSLFDSLSNSIRNWDFFKVLQNVWNIVKTIGSSILNVLKSLVSGISGAMTGFNIDTFLDIIKSIISGGIGLSLINLINAMRDSVGGFTEIIEGVGGCLEAFQSQLQAGTLLKIAAAIAILSVSLLLLASVDKDKLMNAVSAITVLFTDLMLAMKFMTGIGETTKNQLKAGKTVLVMIGMATAILILASALKKIADLDIENLATGLAGVAGLMLVMSTAMKMVGRRGTKGGLQMIFMATAITILADALKSIASLNQDELGTGIMGIAGMLIALVAAVKLLGKGGSALAGAASMIAIAVAVNILSKALHSISGLSWDELGRGLAGMAGALLSIAIAMKLMPVAKSLASGVAIVLVAGAMLILVSAIKSLKDVSWESIGKGLLVLGGALGTLAIGLNLMRAALPGAVALAVASGALLLLVPVMQKLGGLSWEEIGKGLVTLGGAIAILATGLNFMVAALPGAAALLVASIALAIFVPILGTLGSMSWKTIAKGLGAIAAGFAILGVAGLVLAPIVPVILALSASLALVGVAVVAVSVGLAIGAVAMIALATGITALAAALTAGATAIVAGLTVIIVGIIDLIPTILKKIGEGLIEICEVIIASIPTIAKAIEAIVLSLIEILVKCVPPLVDALILLADKLLVELVAYAPTLIQNLADFLVELIDGLSEHLPRIIQSAVNLVVQIVVGVLKGISDAMVTFVKAGVDIFTSFFEGVIDAFSSTDTKSLMENVEMVRMLVDMIKELALAAVLAPIAMLGVAEMGLVVGELVAMISTVGTLAQLPGLKWLVEEGGKMLETVGTSIGKFFGGIVGGMAEGITNKLPQIGTNISEFMINAQPFIVGAKMIDASTAEGVKSLAEAILALTAANVLDGLTSWFTGGSSLVAFGKELAEFGPHFANYYNAVKGIDGSVVQASANAAMTIAEMSSKLPNQGGVVSWFTGDNTLSKFAEELAAFGPSMKKYADSISGIDSNAVVNSANAAKALSEMAEGLPNSGGVISWFTGDNSIDKFGKNLVSFGGHLKKYGEKISGINAAHLKDTTTSFVSIVNTLKGIDGTEFASLDGFSKSLNKISVSGIEAFIKAFDNAEQQFKNAGKKMIETFLKGASEAKVAVDNAFATMITSTVASITGKYDSFYNAGAYLVKGFANGINEFTYLAEAKSRAMAAAAAAAAKDELDEHSPSKVGYGIGKFFGVGFVNAIGDYASKSYDASANMAIAAKTGLNDSISKIRDFIETGMDTQPTIRPVLDLSDVRSGVNTMNGLLAMDSMGIASGIGSVSAMMNRRNQNGNVDEIISAINKLNKNLENAGGTQYNINGITYDDGSNIAEAVKSIARAAVVGRRV